MRHVFLLLFLFGCGSTPQTTPTARAALDPVLDAPSTPEQTKMQGRTLSRVEHVVVARMMRIAEENRKLTFKAPVFVRIQSPEQIKAHMQVDLQDELPKMRLRESMYKALHLVPEDMDLITVALKLLEEEIAGYYDPKRKVMVIRDSVMAETTSVRVSDAAFNEKEGTIVHEFVHALTDQYFDLESLSDRTTTIDEETALSSLVEGDATLSMFMHQFRPLLPMMQRPEVLANIQHALKESMGGSVNSGNMQHVPDVIKVPLLFQYMNGMLFLMRQPVMGRTANELERAIYERVDFLYAHPPKQTRMILHPESYDAEFHSNFSALITEAEYKTACGETQFVAETLGELETGIFLAQDAGFFTNPKAEGLLHDKLYTSSSTASSGVQASSLAQPSSLQRHFFWHMQYADDASADKALLDVQEIRFLQRGYSVETHGNSIFVYSTCAKAVVEAKLRLGN